MTHVTCRLTAKNRDQFRNPMLSNRVWAILHFADLFTVPVEIGSVRMKKPSANICYDKRRFVQCWAELITNAELVT